MLSDHDAMIWEFLLDRYDGGRILAAECSKALLEKVKTLSPAPEIVEWGKEERREFCMNNWPGTEGLFSLVLLGRLAERVENIAIIKVLRTHLTEDGTLLSIWGNAQHWSVARDLLTGNGHFSNNPIFQKLPHRLFSINEIFDMFSWLKFKALRINSSTSPIDEASLQNLANWCRVNDRRLIETTLWCAEARLYTDDVITLRKELTPELRKELARALRRIENEIDPEVNCELVKCACVTHRISNEYLTSFTKKVTLNPQLVLKKLSEQNNGR